MTMKKNRKSFETEAILRNRTLHLVEQCCWVALNKCSTIMFCRNGGNASVSRSKCLHAMCDLNSVMLIQSTCGAESRIPLV